MNRLRQIWQAKDLRNKILFVLAMLVVYRIAAHIPIPGIDASNLKDFFSSNQILGLVNVFSGGGLMNFSIVMLGVGPYITASIILQLLVMIVPKLEEIQKEGESGQRRINNYTRWLTVPLAMINAYGFIVLLQRQGRGLIGELNIFQWITAIVVATAGTMLLVWIGELITTKKVGNGTSLIIFAGIVASLPGSIGNTLAVFDASSQIFNIVMFIVIAIVTIISIVIISEGQRNIPVSYARQIRGGSTFGGVNTHLPLRVNQAGVIPIIFAISVVLFPPLVARFFQTSTVAWVASFSAQVINFFGNQLYYGIMYFVLVFAFTYFYTAVIFKPDQIAENLQKQGGFVPGIRPGQQTAEYLMTVMNRIILAGALFLGIISVLPIIVQQATGMATMTIGGTSILIVVAVVIETVKQIDAQLVMRDYDGL
ncbi:MAG: preprotein translocase subunit SecY [Candidatus Komeilibacteria bacterium]